MYGCDTFVKEFIFPITLCNACASTFILLREEIECDILHKFTGEKTIYCIWRKVLFYVPECLLNYKILYNLVTACLSLNQTVSQLLFRNSKTIVIPPCVCNYPEAEYC